MRYFDSPQSWSLFELNFDHSLSRYYSSGKSGSNLEYFEILLDTLTKFGPEAEVDYAEADADAYFYLSFLFRASQGIQRGHG